MDIAVHRISTAIENNEKILIFGDYDVDGITATTILYEFLSYVGADVSYYIPHRILEGYGLQVNHILNYALPEKINLIITVDCGSSSHRAVNIAQNAGIDVIITDHHSISEKRPSAIAVINPKRHDCPSGFDNLAGVGVAFYLLICLRKHLRENHFWENLLEPNLKNLCDLVALGTVADVVPLIDENRIFSKTGLEVINSGNRSGIKALIEVCGINSHFAEADDIAYKLAPRLNAAGRMSHAKTAVELLTATNFGIARQIANTLNKMNLKRQGTQKEIFEEILKYIKDHPELLDKNTLVLENHGWHEGVLGIVASKLVERHFCPVVLISLKNGIGKGSARSIPGFNLYEGLLACSNELESFGGHSMAAGLTIKAENIASFKKKFKSIIHETTAPEDFVPNILIDYELDFDEITAELIDELENLKPFGMGNNEPLFMAKNVKVSSSKIVGKNHRRMILMQPGSKTYQSFHAIRFNTDPETAFNESFDRVAFRLHWNRWNGKKNSPNRY